jgi:hypothetical protein
VSQPSLRWRVTGVAAAAVAAVLAVAGVVVVQTLHGQLIEDVDDSTVAVADGLATVVDSGGEPGPLVVRGDDDAFAQVVDDGGRVVAATENLAGLAPVSSSAVPGIRTVSDLPPDDARFRVLTPIVHEVTVAGRDRRVDGTAGGPGDCSVGGGLVGVAVHGAGVA